MSVQDVPMCSIPFPDNSVKTKSKAAICLQVAVGPAPAGHSQDAVSGSPDWFNVNRKL